MPFVSLTRLRIRFWHLVPLFLLRGGQSSRQAAQAEGNLAVSLLSDRHRTYWTLTSWETAEHMKSFMLNGAHRQVMPKLMDWCDEAAVAHWTQDSNELPTWEEAHARLQENGRPSKVRHPSPNQLEFRIAAPRVRASSAVRFKASA